MVKHTHLNVQEHKQTVWQEVLTKKETQTEKPERWKKKETDIVLEPEPLQEALQVGRCSSTHSLLEF